MNGNELMTVQLPAGDIDGKLGVGLFEQMPRPP